MKHSEYKASYEKEIRLLTEDTANTAQKFARKQKTNKDKLSDNSYHMHTFKPADMHNTFSIVSFRGLSQTETI